jgi:hypothetical protein
MLKSCPVGVGKELHNVRPPALLTVAYNLRMLIKKGTECVIARGLENIFSFHYFYINTHCCIKRDCFDTLLGTIISHFFPLLIKTPAIFIKL